MKCAIYCRLSKEDGNTASESESIFNTVETSNISALMVQTNPAGKTNPYPLQTEICISLVVPQSKYLPATSWSCTKSVTISQVQETALFSIKFLMIQTILPVALVALRCLMMTVK